MTLRETKTFLRQSEQLLTAEEDSALKFRLPWTRNREI